MRDFDTGIILITAHLGISFIFWLFISRHDSYYKQMRKKQKLETKKQLRRVSNQIIHMSL